MPSNLMILFWLTILFTPSSSSHLHLDPDETKSFSELITLHGYVLQEYHVLTEDDYILTVHRVVPPHFDPLLYNIIRKPVIAFHGILVDSASWFIASPFLDAPDHSCGDNFGFCLLQTGRYDLWLPNARGNRYSEGHLWLTKKDPEFWKFSFDEIAGYDIPAFVELVRKVTHHQTVGYIGFSQGGGAMFAFLSEHPQYASIIRPFIAWAPAVMLANMPSPLRIEMSLEAKTLPFFPGQHFLSSQVVNEVFKLLSHTSTGRTLQLALFQILFGASDSINTTRFPVTFNHFPSPCSNWQMAHFGQAITGDRFAHFDYGTPELNQQKYRSKISPDYPIENIPPDIKLVIMYGATDALVSESDSKCLVQKLRQAGIPLVEHKIAKSLWSHNDFMNGIGAGRLVYEHTVRYLDLMAW